MRFSSWRINGLTGLNFERKAICDLWGAGEKRSWLFKNKTKQANQNTLIFLRPLTHIGHLHFSGTLQNDSPWSQREVGAGGIPTELIWKYYKSWKIKVRRGIVFKAWNDGAIFSKSVLHFLDPKAVTITYHQLCQLSVQSLHDLDKALDFISLVQGFQSTLIE